MTPAELAAIRARDRDYDDIFDEQARMPKDIAHRLVAWPVADRRALLKLVDELRERLAEAEALLRKIAEMQRGNASIDLRGPVAGRIDAFLARENERE